MKENKSKAEIIQQCNIHRGVLRLNMYNLTCDIGKKEGGISSRRTLANEERMNKKLEKKWGSRIVRKDTTIRKGARENIFDINPIIKIPIKGV